MHRPSIFPHHQVERGHHRNSGDDALDDPVPAPLWEDCDAQVDEGSQIEPDWDMAAQPVPDYCVDQSVNG